MSRALRLKAVLTECGLSLQKVSDLTGVPKPRLSELCSHGYWPRGVDREQLKRKITAAVRRADGDSRALFKPAGDATHSSGADTPKKKPRQRANAAGAALKSSLTNEVEAMLLRKQTLTPEARRHFQLPRDPFEEPTTSDEVYLNSELRYVRESMYEVARRGGFLAVIGESGAGKSTLRLELLERIRTDEESIIVVEPYVLAMESQDKVGKTLRAHHLAEAMMASIDPLSSMKSSPEARFRQLHLSLKASARAGHSHVLVIEEAHCLPLATLKHLKRFLELRDGMKRLLAIILLGQPELADKLSELNPEVREVVQRIEKVEIPPLGRDLEAYLKHRFSRMGLPLDKVFAAGAVEALRTKLTPTRASGTLVYPLAVANAATAAINKAASTKRERVTADVVAGI